MTPFWDDRAADWVAKRIPNGERGFGECVAMGVARGKRVVAGVVLHNWEPEHGLIEVSAAADDPRWMTRRVMSEAFDYVFGRAGCQVAVARDAESNASARRIWNALGATEHTIPRLMGRNEAGCLHVLTDDAWNNSKFNEARHGKK